MQRKQQQKELPKGQTIMTTILESIPKQANVKTSKCYKDRI